ncbi:energy transducer TonB [candidate division WOR-3 bacterium]|nr:energy transducer TonB [candidate division WOR-3 bacterium]
MKEKIVDLKKQYPLNIRIGFLITLVLLILGFKFIPETKRQPYLPKFSKPIQVDKLPPQLQNIVKPPPPPKPKMPVAAKSDEDVEAETIEKTDFSGLEKKEADVDFAPPRFVAYEVAPKPLNEGIMRQGTYPEVARRLGIEGKLYLELWIDTKGTVRNVIITKPLYPAIDKIAKERAYQLKFSPAMQNDKPVAVRLAYPVIFKLEN